MVSRVVPLNETKTPLGQQSPEGEKGFGLTHPPARCNLALELTLAAEILAVRVGLWGYPDRLCRGNPPPPSPAGTCHDRHLGRASVTSEHPSRRGGGGPLSPVWFEADHRRITRVVYVRWEEVGVVRRPGLYLRIRSAGCAGSKGVMTREISKVDWLKDSLEDPCPLADVYSRVSSEISRAPRIWYRSVQVLTGRIND